MRTNNGLENCNDEFDKFCANNDIARHRTFIGNPRQNDLAECMNKTVMERVRCMLSESGMPKIFWAEAAATACYVINRSPSSALNFRVPNEVWSNASPNYDNMKPFSCLAYMFM